MREISPSMLPKLAECGLFVGGHGYSEAAQRGTLLDNVIRAEVAGEEWGAAELSEEDNAAVTWGVETLRRLAAGDPVETREEHLAMHVPGMSKAGTADAVCKKQRWVADIKTGQIRNYREQLAAYALACMDSEWEESWTAHVVYVDQQLVRSYEFSREQAERIVDEVTSRASSPLTNPRPCEYCNWCAIKDTCPALVRRAHWYAAQQQSAMIAEQGKSLSEMRDKIAADPEHLAEFGRRYKWFEAEFGKPLLEALRKRLEDGEEIDGWKLSSTSRRYVQNDDAIAVVSHLSPTTAYYAGGGKMSADKFLELAKEAGLENPENMVKVAAITQMRQTKRKEK